MRLTCGGNRCIYISLGHVVLAVCSLGSELNLVREFNYAGGNESQIVSVTVSDDGKYLFAGYANKHLCCWDTSSGYVLGHTVLTKRPTGLAFAEVADRKLALVVSDKAGLLSGVDVPLLKNQVLLAGHTASVLTDIEKFGSVIASADRDEKIRLSCFPNMTTIAGFCLGHTSVVTSISFLKPSTSSSRPALLISTGWDHKLFLWDPVNGDRLAECLLSTSQSATAAVESTAESTTVALTTAETAATAAAAVVVHPAEEVVDLAPETASTNDIVDESASAAAAVAEDVLDPERILAEGGGDEQEGGIDRTYDEASAGQYPLRVVACTSTALPVVAVIYKGNSTLSMFPVVVSVAAHSTAEGSSSSTAAGTASVAGSAPQYEFGKELSIDLPGLPCDAYFSDDNKLYVVLPKPSCLQVYEVRIVSQEAAAAGAAAGESVVQSSLLSSESLVKEIQEKCRQYDCDFSQQLVFSVDEDGDAEKGMRKHALDKPFSINRNIDTSKRKGAKRSRSKKN